MIHMYGFDMHKKYFIGSYSKLIRDLERGYKRKKDGTINKKATLYAGEPLEIQDLTPEMLATLMQNAVDVLHNSIMREKWNSVIRQTNLMTNPRWRFKDKVPEVVLFFKEAVKDTPAEGKLFQGKSIPHKS